MDADTSLGPGSQLRHRTWPGAPKESGFPRGRPVPAVFRDPPEPDRVRAEETSSLAASFPLIFFGAGFAFLGAYVRYEQPAETIGHIPLWIPFFGVGLIALVGGVLSVFAKPGETPPNMPAGGAHWRGAPRPVPRVTSDRILRPPFPVTENAGRRPARTGPTGSRKPERSWPAEPVPLPAAGPPKPLRVADPEEPSARSDSSLLLRELDAIDADLRASRGPRPLARPWPATEAEPALSGRAPGAELRPAGRSMDDPSGEDSVPRDGPSVEAPMSCIGCGSEVPSNEEGIRCVGCEQPLCADCLDRSKAAGNSNLCPFCSVLDVVHRK
jgi:hypothetical protein